MPTISVIVPVYKVEPYLRRCVDSILHQTYTDFELILVDDGSPDGCPALCDEYAAQDSRVRVIHQQNGGVSRARNMGVKAAIGDYITFVDSDDWVEEEFLEELFSNASLNDADMSICSYNIVSDAGCDTVFLKNAVLSNIDALNYLGMLGNSAFRAPWNKLLRKEILREIPFPEDRKFSEDTAVVYRWIYEANRIICSTKPLYNYYLSENGVSRKFSPVWLSLFATYDEMLQFFQMKDMSALYSQYARDAMNWYISFAKAAKESNNALLHRKISFKAKKRLVRYFLNGSVPFNKTNYYIYASFFPILSVAYSIYKNLRS